jgi:repressor LexA
MCSSIVDARNREYRVEREGTGESMDRKDQIFRFIKSEISTKGIPPTIREIGRKFDISSTNGVRYFLGKLEDEGLIRRSNWTARGIRLARSFRDDAAPALARSVPVLGRVPAGRPVVSEENIEGTLLLDERLTKGYEVFAVKVRGDSMIGAGINDGDFAVVKKDVSPSPGDLVVGMIDDEVTLKRLIRRGEDLILKPENDEYPEINLSRMSSREIRIIGTVIAIVRKY